MTLEVIISTGGPYHAYHMARGASKAGYLKRFITTIFSRGEAGIDRRLVTQIPLPELLGQAVWRLPLPGSIYLSYLVRDNLFDLRARAYVDGGDIFHVFNNFGLYSMRKAKSLGMKTVVERSAAHPVSAHRVLREEYARFGLRFPRLSDAVVDKHVAEYEAADVVMVCSDFVRRTMIENGTPESKLRQVHFGFEPEKFRPLPDLKTDDTFRVLFVGSVSLQKGLPYLLEAFKTLNLPDAELVFVGGAYPDAKSFLPAYEGWFKHIWFVPQDELLNLYNRASVFVLPSLQDGFGMVVYEAAACGLPVIISQNVGAEIRDGQDGFIVPARDAGALAEKIALLYEDPVLRRTMGESAREYVQAYTWDAYHRQLKDHYDAIAGSA